MTLKESPRRHTPGPWHLDKHADAFTVCDGKHNGENAYGVQIALVRANKSEFAANARLIAAAPDMLAALETLLARCGPLAAANEPAALQARAAIARAKGEEMPHGVERMIAGETPRVVN